MEENRYFQQLTVYDNFKLVNQYRQLEQVDHTLGCVEIKSVALLDTMKGKSYEGQYLSGKELLITGILQADVYFSYSNCAFLYKITYSIPFSTYIIVPEDLCEVSKENLMCSAMELSATMIMPGQLFVNGVVFIEYLDEV